MNEIIIENLNKLQSEGMRKLVSYRQEIMIMESQLATVTITEHGPETHQLINHFQNQFSLRQDNIEDLRSWINEHTQQVGREVMINEGQIRHSRIEEQNILTEEYNRVGKMVQQLSTDFTQFLVRCKDNATDQ